MVEKPGFLQILKKLASDPDEVRPSASTPEPAKNETVFTDSASVVEEVKKQLAQGTTSISLQLADGVWNSTLQQTLLEIDVVRVVQRVGTSLTVNT